MCFWRCVSSRPPTKRKRGDVFQSFKMFSKKNCRFTHCFSTLSGSIPFTKVPETHLEPVVFCEKKTLKIHAWSRFSYHFQVAKLLLSSFREALTIAGKVFCRIKQLLRFAIRLILGHHFPATKQREVLEGLTRGKQTVEPQGTVGFF